MFSTLGDEKEIENDNTLIKNNDNIMNMNRSIVTVANKEYLHGQKNNY